MGMVITCDKCGRVLSIEAGDQWHWDQAIGGGDTAICLCSRCDPVGQRLIDERAAEGIAQRERVLRLAKEREQQLLDEGGEAQR